MFAKDAREFESLLEANKTFDNWLKNAQSRHSSVFHKSSGRPHVKVMKKFPRLNEITLEIAIENREAFKDKPLPVDKYSTRTQIDSSPYQHL